MTSITEEQTVVRIKLRAAKKKVDFYEEIYCMLSELKQVEISRLLDLAIPDSIFIPITFHIITKQQNKFFQVLKSFNYVAKTSRMSDGLEFEQFTFVSTKEKTRQIEVKVWKS